MESQPELNSVTYSYFKYGGHFDLIELRELTVQIPDQPSRHDASFHKSQAQLAQQLQQAVPPRSTMETL